MANKFAKFLKKPGLLFVSLGHMGYLNFIPDEEYVKKVYKIKLGKTPDLDNPKTLNEKLQWLKLYDHNPIYTTLADKYAVRDYLAERIGEEHLVPLVGGPWKSFDEIDFAALPEKFVLKCTHDSGGVVICTDKAKLDKAKVRKKIEKCLKHNFYPSFREWPYKNIEPQIIAEQYMVDESGVELKDYKIFCMNGKAIYVEVDFNRAVRHKLNAYTLDWKMLDFCDASPNDRDADIKCPERLDEMIETAELLAADFTFMRVDFYSIYTKYYVGELTLYPGSGFIAFNPPEADAELGKKLTLPRKEDLKQ